MTSFAAVKAASKAENNFPDFKKPPVSEVACGATFVGSKDFTVAHLGLFWARIRDEFPEAAHAAPLATPADGWIDQNLGLPLPRQWFISKNKQGLIQLQGDCLFFNWRKIAEDDVYPRYDSVIASYRRYLSTFLEFLRDVSIPVPAVTGCELTYVNHISQEDGWKSVHDLPVVFRDMHWQNDSGRFLPIPRNLSWRMQFALPTAGVLTASLSHAVRVKDQVPTLKLELSAKAALPNKTFDDIWSWFDVAHEWIVRGFVDLTQHDIQRRTWGRTK
jgi:uncharacterized protein (TIGR04255 family)